MCGSSELAVELKLGSNAQPVTGVTVQFHVFVPQLGLGICVVLSMSTLVPGHTGLAAINEGCNGAVTQTVCESRLSFGQLFRAFKRTVYVPEVLNARPNCTEPLVQSK